MVLNIIILLADICDTTLDTLYIGLFDYLQQLEIILMLFIKANRRDSSREQVSKKTKQATSYRVVALLFPATSFTKFSYEMPEVSMFIAASISSISQSHTFSPMF
jgi:hypothetical protein